MPTWPCIVVGMGVVCCPVLTTFCLWITEHQTLSVASPFIQDADGATPESFEWLSQLRFDFNPSTKDPTQGLSVRMADAKFEYGFEYLGIGERLVQTPLTDR